MRERLHLCVSLHDVAPATWLSCQRVLAAVREVVDVPVTLLVVPAYFGQCSALAPGLRRRHVGATGPGRRTGSAWRLPPGSGNPGVCTRPAEAPGLHRRRRRVLDLGESEAFERLLLGHRWFRADGWPLAGFVPPAWLSGSGAWKAVHAFPAIRYVTTFSHIHAMQTGISPHAPWPDLQCAGSMAPGALAGLVQPGASPLSRPGRARSRCIHAMRHTPRFAARGRADWSRCCASADAVTKADFVTRFMPQRPEPARARRYPGRAIAH